MHIYKYEIIPGQDFKGPKNLTFGYTPWRDKFCVWFDPSLPYTELYTTLPTGEELNIAGTHVDTAHDSQGFVLHLVRYIV